MDVWENWNNIIISNCKLKFNETVGDLRGQSFWKGVQIYSIKINK